MKRPISEKELVYFSQTQIIDCLLIKQLGNGHYSIHVQLKDSETEYYVQTQRGEVRTWVSLDRLVKHLRTNCEHIKVIKIFLKKEIHYEKKKKPQK